MPFSPIALPANGRHRGLVAAAAALLLAASAWQATTTRLALRAGDRLVDRMRYELYDAETVLSTLKDAETGERGYLLTGTPAYLEPYNAARARLDADLAQLRQNPAPGPLQAVQQARIASLAAAKMAVLRQTIALWQAGNQAAALAIVRSGRGKLIMDQARASVDRIRAIDEVMRAEMRARTRPLTAWALPVAGTVLANLLLGALAQAWWRDRQIAAVHLAGRDRFVRAFGLTRGMLRDFDGRITFWGPGMARLYGYSAAEAVGQLSHTLLDTRFPADLAATETNLLAHGDWQGELVHRHRDGSTITVMSHWVLHRDSTDGKVSVVEMNYDISALRRADTHLPIALEVAGLGTWAWDVGGTGALIWDARTSALLGLPPNGDTSYEIWRAIVLPADLPAVEATIARVLDPADPLDAAGWEFRVVHPGGRIAWLAAASRAQFVVDADVPAGRTTARLVGTVRDISAARYAELERERAAALLRTIIETSPGLIYAKDRQGCFLLANAASLALIGKSWGEVAGRTDIDVLADPVQGAEVMANDRRVMVTGAAEALEERVAYPDGHDRVWLSTKTPMRDLDGQVIGLVGVSMDITERTAAADRQLLMIHELNHRVKNTLATVQAVATETLRGADPGQLAVLNGRLEALAAVHDVLTRESWHGAALHEVVAGALAPFGGNSRARFQVAGPKLQLVPRAALALAMGLHELATNALKYGALQTDDGRVTVHWEIDAPPYQPFGQQEFRLAWTEQGGPPVAPPTRRSFGTRMIERALASDLGGTTKILFEPAGVRCLIDAPLAEIAVGADTVALPLVGSI